MATAIEVSERRATPRGLRPGLALLVDAIGFDGCESSEPLAATAYAIFKDVEVIGSGVSATSLNRLFAVVEAFPPNRAQGWRAAILANVFAVVTRGSATDYEQAAQLAQVGPRHAAAVQCELDDLLGCGSRRPFTTTAILGLSDHDAITGELLRAGRGEQAASKIAAECGEVAFRLLLAGVERTPPAAIPCTAQQFRDVVGQEGVNAWRGLLANIPPHPWGPAVGRLEALAEEVDLPNALRAIQACARVSRKRMEENERLTIAREIRQLVGLSGRSQREFASAVGTSASRMSTYVNGGVVPSSAMFLRMQRVAAHLAETAAIGKDGRRSPLVRG